MMNLIGIVGTNASFSYNRKLLAYMKNHFALEANIEIREIADIPLFCEDLAVPSQVVELEQAIEHSDGVIFSTPEYDHSIPAGLKSVLEWLSWGKTHSLKNVPVMIVGVSLGQLGTVYAQENLRQILASPGLDSFVLPGNQFMLGHGAKSFDEKGDLTDDGTISFLEACFQNFVDYTKTVAPLRRSDPYRKRENLEDEFEEK